MYADLLYNTSMTTQILLDDEIRVQIFKALADQTRLEIVKTLYRSEKEMSCGEVGEHCEASKSNTSYHFRTLREAKLLKIRKDAQTKYMSLNRETFELYLPGFLETLL